MVFSRGRAWLIVSVYALISGCATNIDNMIDELNGNRLSIELEQVPFHSQVTDQCGPSALASLLNDAGVTVSADDLKSRVYIPGRQGSLQLELMAAARHFGRIPYQIDPDLGALVAELEAGRPILVLQNLGAFPLPIWHYAVVVGYLPTEQQFILRSGDKQRLVMSARTFARTWRRGDLWAVVALTPGELPANANAEKYLRSVSATESAGKLDDAVSAYRAAIRRWPDNDLAWLGFGNASYADGELQNAATAYRKILEIRPGDVIAMNNLSQVYVQQGCRSDALELINTALSGVNPSEPVHSYLLETHKQVVTSSREARCL